MGRPSALKRKKGVESIPTRSRRRVDPPSVHRGQEDDVLVLGGRRSVRSFGLWTLDLYIIRAFLTSYFVCAVSFTGLYIAVEAFTKIDRFIPSGQNSLLEIFTAFVSNLVNYHLAMVPTIYVNYMGPILTLAAAMFSLTLLNRGNEFTAIKVAGVSIYRILLPIFILAGGFTILTFVLQEWVIPELREPIRKALAVSRTGALRPRPFYDPQNNLHIEVRRYRPDRKVAESVTIKKWDISAGRDADENHVIDAQAMIWVPDPDSTFRNEKGHWLLRNGSVQRWQARWRGKLIYAKDPKDKKRHLKERFDDLVLESTLLPIDLETSDQDISYLSWRELKTQFERQPYHRHLKTRLHQHFAFPLSHIILLLIGIPFVLNYRTRSFFLSLAMSFFFCAGYFLLSSMTISLAADPGDASLSPVIASWLPNVLFGSLGLTIFTNMRT